MASNEWKIPKGFDANQRKATKKIFDALRNSRQVITPEMQRMLTQGNFDGFLKLVDYEVLAGVFSAVTPILSAQALMTGLSTFTDAGISSRLIFDAIDARAVQYAQEATARLVTDITAELRESIRGTIASATRGELTYKQAAQQIRTNLPLTPRDAGAVSSYQERQTARLIEEGMTQAKAEAKAALLAEKYADKLTRARAETISRTEIARAASQGRYEGWAEGVDAGYIDAASNKEWIAESDACDICAPMDGVLVPWNEAFESGDDMPPAHPNCRCAAALLPPDYGDSAFTPNAIPLESE